MNDKETIKSNIITLKEKIIELDTKKREVIAELGNIKDSIMWRFELKFLWKYLDYDYTPIEVFDSIKLYYGIPNITKIISTPKIVISDKLEYSVCGLDNLEFDKFKLSMEILDYAGYCIDDISIPWCQIDMSDDEYTELMTKKIHDRFAKSEIKKGIEINKDKEEKYKQFLELKKEFEG